MTAPASAPSVPRARWSALAALSLAGGWFALSLVRHWFELWPGVSVWYAPAALIAAGCILWGWRAVVPVFAAAAVIAYFSHRVGEPLERVLVLSLALKLIYAAGAALLRRARFSPTFAAPRDVMYFATYALVSGLLAALVNTTDLVAVGILPRGEWRAAIAAFWVGDVVAVLALAPALLALALRLTGHRAPPLRRWRYHSWRLPAQALSVPVALWLGFGVAPHLGFLAYAICFLPLGWVALTRGVRGAVVVTAALAIGAVVMLQHSGVLPRDNLEVQTFMASLALAGLLLGSVAEMSERGQELLSESEERYRALVELLPVPLAVHDNGRVLYANPAMARAFGAPSPESLVGRSLAEMADPSSRQLVTERAQRIAAGESLDAANHRFRRLDGGPTLDLEAVSTPIPYNGGMAALTVARDVTERNRLENELRHSQRMDAVGQLAGGVAHDFNNLLTVITGYMQMMVADTAPGTDLHVYAQETLDAAGRASALTRQLLAFSRKQVSHPREVAVNEVVAATETMLRRLLGASIELRVSLGADAGTVLIDPVQLDQVILNLALNGRDAMPGGGVLAIHTGHVEVPGTDPRWRRLPAGRYAALVVRDGGVGIAESIRERIFDPFFTTKEAGRGTGLGLATVYAIVATAKGSIFVDTTVGEGSTFTVLLPVTAGTSGQASGTAGAVPDGWPLAPAVQPLAAAVRVLLVEDDDAVRAVTRRMLEQAGFRVVEAPNGHVGLEVFQALEGSASAVDVVVSDLAMPGMNGAALARAIEARSPQTPLILVSGFADAALERDVAGLTLLSKPLDAAALVAAVREAVARHAAR